MKIVIDVPEGIMEYIANDNCFAVVDGDVLARAIANGTPLPKGHGRLGDLDAVEQEMINGIRAGNLEVGYEEYTNINGVDDCVECVRYAETIIEAEMKGASDEQ